MKEIYCDICKKRMGCNVGMQAISFYGGEPSPREIGFSCGVIEKKDADLCLECMNSLTEAMHIEYLKLKKEKRPLPEPSLTFKTT